MVLWPADWIGGSLTANGGPQHWKFETMAETASAFPRICLPTESHDCPVAGLPSICQPISAAFAAATGWVVEFEESRSSYRRRRSERLGVNEADGRLHITDLSADWPAGKPAASRESCDQLVGAISQLHRQAQQYRDELRLAQVQLAVPGRLTVPRPDAEKLQRLLGKLLETAIQQLGFDSGAVMVLDEATTMLVQRIGIGPHFSGSDGQGRLLGECRADVEALAGSVITLTRRSETTLWQTPVGCRSAVCIPISSMHSLLGTLWLTSETSREVQDAETNFLEIIAGRIAAELENAALRAGHPAESRIPPVAEACLDNPYETAVHQELAQPPFEGWQIEQPRPETRFRAMQTLACSQVATTEQLQLLIGCGLHQAEHDELQLARLGFGLFKGLQLDAQQAYRSLQEFLAAEAAFKPTARFACLLIDPLSGEFDFHGHASLRTELQSTGRIDRREPGRHLGFLLPGARLSVHCFDCTQQLLIVHRQQTQR